ncbi:uroporphyrinogen-III C-methyltransferase [Geobacter sp. DSM 9736]|uniref:uroporphyrinogen-III C-methyltransferase n=1 Tax=Geobacter sp. DSM 9736 TaxID=1277350 RepID=UPI000B505EC8|nr:uroporphyrinogen-III C-methyltransferase [Geobacter sp. DSM 9736]SNB47321.1 uroporphyrinogen-III synthase /uroporphyrinogen-III C-methyltransferase [Geobacter sp. DSM 9736]
MSEKPQKIGRVYLIGAGPGDPGLITVRGRECLRRADVVVYDYLANEALLDSAPSGAELIYAGKIGGLHNHEQSQINELLVRKALAGHVVARLKGGDPFVFGRGGEECEALAAAGVPFEIVPGVTAGIGAAAYAGIPLTHRDFTTSVAFVTGHEGAHKDASEIDWQGLSLGSGTIVFYMGMKNLPLIAQNLIGCGRPPETPVALIRWGTRAEQVVLTGNLGDIAEKARKANFKPPAITVVGEVVSLRDKLRWFDNRPFSGKGILVTRAADQAGEFSSMLERYGAKIFECPTISISPPEDWLEVDTAIQALSGFDWTIFTSANAVRMFFMRLGDKKLDTRAFGSCLVCAVGPKTAAALSAFGIRADLVPPDYKAEGVVAAFKAIGISGKKILFPKADRAREVITKGLTALDAQLIAPVLYRNITPESVPEKVLAALEEGQIACATFTSSSTVENLAAILGENRMLRLLSNVAIASIGPITSRTCRELGLHVDIEPAEYTLEALTEEMLGFFRRSN